MVEVGDKFYAVRIKTAADDVVPPAGAPANTGRKTVGASLEKLGYRSDTIFGAGYERMGGRVLEAIKGYEGVEAFVKMQYADLAKNNTARYRELLRCARTVDLRIVEYSDRSREELENDDTFELHMSTIALQDYGSTTGNWLGLDAVSGVADTLMPASVAIKAAAWTNAEVKLRNNLRSKSGGSTASAGGKGGAIDLANRQCFNCWDYGHEAKNCPHPPQANAKGKGKGKGKDKATGAAAATKKEE